MTKSRQEINRQNYLRNKDARKAKARERIAQVRASWREAIDAWDRLHEWTEAPAEWGATGLSQWAIESAIGNQPDDEEEV